MLTRVLIVGRTSVAIETLKAYLQGSAGLDVRGHVITNGHIDPLEGINFAPDIVLLHFEAKRTAELSAWAARPKEGRPILIVVGPGGDGDATRLAIRSGARDFLPEPVGKADLVATLQQVRAALRAPAAALRPGRQSCSRCAQSCARVQPTGGAPFMLSSAPRAVRAARSSRSEEHTSELQSLR